VRRRGDGGERSECEIERRGRRGRAESLAKRERWGGWKCDETEAMK
jgi:hypothetical protein